MRKATVFALFFLFSCGQEATVSSSDTATTTSSTATTTTAADTMSTTVQPPATNDVGHFQFWTVEDTPVKKSAHVEGQFGPVEARLKSLDFIGAPAQKNQEPVPDNYENGVHLTAYALRNPPPFSKHVLVSNQFTEGERDWQIGSPRLLLVPATKLLNDNLPPEAPKGPHFLCYDVQEGPSPQPHNVEIKDQFYRQTIQSLKPKYLCVPANKNNEGYWNEAIHLVLYEYQGYAFDPPKQVYAKDQFDNYPLKVKESRMLGVPTKKRLP